MTASHSITCGHCKERHSGPTRAAVIAQIKECQSDEQYERDMKAKAEYARLEQEQEEAAYLAEMEAEIAAEKAQMAYLEGGWDKTGEYSYDPTMGW